VDGDAELVVGKFLNTNDFGNIFTIHGVVRRAEGEGDENAHTLVVFLAAGGEIYAFLGSVNADGKVFKVNVAGLGGTYTDRLYELGAAMFALMRKQWIELFWHSFFRDIEKSYYHYSAWGLKRQGPALYLILCEKCQYGTGMEAGNGREDSQG
jgi:hypothetical protein